MTRVGSKRGWAVATLIAVAGLTLVGCGDDDGAAGTGMGASGGFGGIGGDGGTGALGGTGGSGGVGGAGGVGGDDTDGGLGGVGGVGGTGGSGGVGGTGGTGGAEPCPGGCADNNDCTADACENGTCVHPLDGSLCEAGESCTLTGCVAGTACSMPSECEDADNCTVNETCNNSAAACEYEILVGDDDGQPPASCGGGDCDDADNTIHPGATEACDGDDNDCDEAVDEQATCTGGRSCVEGACTCGDLTLCGAGPLAQCVDTDTNADNCGECGTDCGPEGTCVDGECTCAAPNEECGVGPAATCVNTDASQQHCGACNMPCGPTELCSAGACEDCGADGQPCCAAGGGGLSSDGCPGAALICTGERGTASSMCGCPSTHEICGTGQNEACVNTDNDRANCGTCGEACEAPMGNGGRGEICVAGDCVATCTQSNQQNCTQCGEAVGQPCCFNNIGPLPLYTCPGETVTCNPSTRLCEAETN